MLMMPAPVIYISISLGLHLTNLEVSGYNHLSIIMAKIINCVMINLLS